MYISKKDREFIKKKFNGLCAYSGTPLKDDWQVEHIVPVVRNWWDNTSVCPDAHRLDNMVPVQKIINHYKHSLPLETFKNWFLYGLHERLRKLPKEPKTEKSRKKKGYLLEVASYFNITEDTPFSGKLYFETIDDCNNGEINR